MKVFGFLLALGALATLTSAASPPRRMSKRKALARRQDPHRMLKKRVAHFAASGPGQGALQFASLQDAIMSGKLSSERSARRNLLKKQQTRKIRARQATVFEERAVEKRDEDCDENQAGSGAAPATPSSDAASPNAASNTTSSFAATSDDGDGDDDEECEDDDDDDDDEVSSTSSAPSSVASIVKVANVAHKPHSSSSNGSSSGQGSSSNGNGSSGNGSSSNNGNSGSDNGGSSQSGSNNSGQSDNGNNNNGGSNSGSSSSGGSSSSSGSSDGSTNASASASTSAGTGETHKNGVAGACGTVHADSDFIVALPTSTYAGGSLCGKQIIVTNEATGVSATATVADMCPSCPNPASLDLSTGLFAKFASQDAGICASLASSGRSSIEQRTVNVKWQLAG